MVQSAATGELGSHGTIMTACEAAAVGVAVSLRPAGQGVPGSLCLNCLLQASAPFINCRAQFPLMGSPQPQDGLLNRPPDESQDVIWGRPTGPSSPTMAGLARQS